MNKLIPFFEVNGKTYEIKPTRYLMVEYEKLGEQSQLNEQDKIDAIKLQTLTQEVQELAEKTNEAKEEYFADITNKDLKAKYKAFKENFDETFAELAELEIKNGSSQKLQKETLDLLEKLVIKGLEEQYQGINGKEVWCDYVESVGKANAGEWLVAMIDCLFSKEEDEQENSFLAKMRAKKQLQAQNRSQINRTKKK